MLRIRSNKGRFKRKDNHENSLKHLKQFRKVPVEAIILDHTYNQPAEHTEPAPAEITTSEKNTDDRPETCSSRPLPARQSIPDQSWREGRRVVELGVLADHLLKGCKSCGSYLQLDQCISEQRYGLGSILNIKCTACKDVTGIPTGKRHSGGVWDANTKAAAGMLHAGIGQRKLNMVFAGLNIPSVHHTTLKYREREVGPAIERVAKTSCCEAADIEQSLTKAKTTPDRDGNHTSIEVSFDGAWQKRGSSRSYNSLSGHASMIGKESGKVVAYDVRLKHCRTCEIASKVGKKPSPHDCRKNWTGSSKAMEPSMCVSMLNQLKTDGIPVGTLIMDDDTTSIAKARKEVDAGLLKKSDFNHTKKHLTTKLFNLQSSKKYKLLNTKTIYHIAKCFAYNIKQNQENCEDLKQSIQSIIPHLFGDHLKCDDKWCGYLQNPEKYTPTRLPYKRYLTGEAFKEDLIEILNLYANQAEHLLNLGSSQRNECFNNVVASKNPKACHYSGSESTSFRVAAAVAQTNIGEKYVPKVNKTLFLSPGQHTAIAVERNDKRRTYQGEYQQGLSFKRRRMEKKDVKREDTAAKETREGTTYKSGVFLQQFSVDDIEEIPPAVQPPTPEHLPAGPKYTWIYFDLETTGLGLSDITQMAAKAGDQSFNTFVIPEKPISEEATRITGIAKQDGVLYKDGSSVDAVCPKACIKSFTEWLGQFNSPVLVAHNARFDAMVFCNTLRTLNVNTISSLVPGFIDTLSLMREILPHQKSYKQVSLVGDVLKETYSAHDATEDVRLLEKLMMSQHVPYKVMLNHSFTLEHFFKCICYKLQKDENLKTLKVLLEKNVITNSMMNKIAGSGLAYKHLVLAHSRDGIENVFRGFLSACWSVMQVFQKFVLSCLKILSCKS